MKRTLGVILLVAAPIVVVKIAAGPGSTASSDPAAAPADPAPPPSVECRLAPIAANPWPCSAAILVEARTGTVLFEQAADSSHAPASLAKMMLEVLVLEEIAAGRASFADSVLVSERATQIGGARVELRAGDRAELGALLRAVVVVSANDASIALAEHFAGTEEAFVARMNERAAALGGLGTQFVNAHGLDSPPEESRSTARDLVTIARRLLELPGALELSSLRTATFREGAAPLVSTNELLGTMAGVDGLKTGLTSKAGGCFCGTIEREGVRFISVVLGALPGPTRFEITRSLYELAYAGEPRWVVSAGDDGPARALLAATLETR